MKTISFPGRFEAKKTVLYAKSFICIGLLVVSAIGLSFAFGNGSASINEGETAVPALTGAAAGDNLRTEALFEPLTESVDSVRDDDGALIPVAESMLRAPDGSVSGQFGWNVAITEDTAVVGANSAAYVFIRASGTWNFQEKLPAGGASIQTGMTVAISGDTVIVGVPLAQAPAAYIYVRNAGTWSLQQTLNGPNQSGFGTSVDVFGDTAVVGASVGQGNAYVWVRSGGVWTQQQVLSASDAAANDQFGMAVSINEQRIVVGAPGKATGAGAAYVFVRSGTTWTQEQKLVSGDPGTNEFFGRAVDLAGADLIVGSPAGHDGINPPVWGAAYYFKKDVNWTQLQKLTSSDQQADDQFGFKVSISGDLAIISAAYHDVTPTINKGAAYAFVRCDGPWTQHQKITASNGAQFDVFGWSAAVSGNSVFLASPYNRLVTNGPRGTVYVTPTEDLNLPPCKSEIEVNITADQPDANVNDDVCDADLGQTGNQCSLRAAIETANSHAGSDTITFNIPGGGVQTISVATALPDITSALIIDGTTQPGYVDKPRVQINGPGGGSICLTLMGDGSTVKALAINRFGTGIKVYGNGNTITGVHLGIDADGATIPPEGMRQGTGIEIRGQNNTVLGDRDGTNGDTNANITGNDLRGVYIVGAGATGNRVSGVNFGFAGGKAVDQEITAEQITIEQGSNNTVGGTTPAEVNLIAGGGADGVEIIEGASNNFVKGNAITACDIAVFIGEAANNNQIGGTRDAGERNYITDSEVGVQVGYPEQIPTAPYKPAVGNKIYGNVIGINQNDVFAGNDYGIIVGVTENTDIGSGSFGQHNFISGSNLEGVVLTKDAVGAKVQGNFIGTDLTGAILNANRDGIQVLGNNNQVLNNVISGNNRYGVSITRFDKKDPIPSGNLIDNNRIGVRGSDTGTAIPNDASGVFIDGTGNTITNNVISGNTEYGVEVRRDGNTIKNNKIGTNMAGSSAVPNGAGGIIVTASGNTIEANTISGNTGVGVSLVHVADVSQNYPSGNIVIGNFIGTNAAGTAALPNTLAGVGLADGANNNTIGGTAANSRNVISGNTFDGINLQVGIAANAIPPYQNKIQGNHIGTNFEGSAAIPNGRNGIFVTGASTTLIGGITSDIPAGRNVISGNTTNGISLAQGATLNRISGNYIGTKADGTSALGNVERGVRVGDSTSGTIIGGPEANAGNTIAFNGSNGISLTSDAGNNNIIDPNQIFGNVLAGIDIGEDGVTPNDPADADVGPNKLQNYPAFVFSISGGNLIVSYRVDSAPANSAYGTNGIYVEFFEADATGAGQHFLGSDHYLVSDYNNGSPGSRKKNLGNAAALGFAAGDTMTATATDADGNSSEFAPAVSSAPTSIGGTVTYGNAIGSPSPRSVSNVLLSGAGSTNVSTTTAAPGPGEGTYALMGFGTGSYTVTPTKSGGVNGITSFDAARVSQHVAGPPNPQLTGNQLVVAEVSGNGVLTSFDAAMIAKFVAGPPYAAPGIGSTSTWKFTPVNRTYASVTSNISGEDYLALLMGEVTGNWTNTPARPAQTVSSKRLSAGGPEKGAAVELPSLVMPGGKEIIVPVNVTGVAGSGVISYEFDLRYDPSVIQPVDDGADLKGTASRGLSVVTNASESGLLRVVVYGANPIDENGVLLNLRFAAVGAAGSVSPLIFERVMFNEGEPRVSVRDGRVELF